MDRIGPEEIMEFFSQKKTYTDISNVLQSRFPGERGFSVKSLKRFCKEHISPRVSTECVEELVATAVGEVK